MDIMLMSLKKWQSKRGAKKRHLQLFEPLHFSKFLSYINMMHFKRSLFLCRIEISIKNLLFEMKKLEKKPIEKYHFILLLKMVILLRDFLKIFNRLKAKVRVVQFLKFYHFSTHHFPKDSESARKNVEISILKF